MPAKLAAALRRFASCSTQLEREILKNRDFRSLCEDYGEAVETLDRWSKSAQLISVQRVLQRILEYQKLVRDLEQEIETYLRRTSEDQ